MVRAMFFPWIERIHILQCGEHPAPEGIRNSFLLIFVLQNVESLRVGTYCVAPRKHEIYLFPEGSYEQLHWAKELSDAFIVVSFAVTDDALRQKLRALGPRLEIDHLVVRSCLLNIFNSSALCLNDFSDCMSYNILSLMYHGYVGLQKQAAPVGSLSDNVIFTCSSNEALNRMLNYLDEHIADDISVDELSDAAMQSPKQVGELFKSEYGCTVLQFVSRFRLFKAKELLCFTNHSITEISNKTGFRSIHYFSRVFKEKEKLSPIEYRHAVMLASPSRKAACQNARP